MTIITSISKNICKLRGSFTKVLLGSIRKKVIEKLKIISDINK